MKKIENNFAVTGFVGKDAEIRQFTTASVARFSLAIGRNEKNGGSMAQERKRHFIRQAHQGHHAHSRGLLQARGMERPGRCQASARAAGSHQVL